METVFLHYVLEQEVQQRTFNFIIFCRISYEYFMNIAMSYAYEDLTLGTSYMEVVV
jgi:hypothetical protein